MEECVDIQYLRSFLKTQKSEVLKQEDNSHRKTLKKWSKINFITKPQLTVKTSC